MLEYLMLTQIKVCILYRTLGFCSQEHVPTLPAVDLCSCSSIKDG